MHSKYICIPKRFVNKLKLDGNQMMNLILDENDQIIISKLEI